MQNRIDYLDSIRGLAALSVVFFHLFISIGLGSLAPYRPQLIVAPLHIFWDGAAAVSMFFVLSGFVLSLKYIRHDPETNQYREFNISDFYIARFFRLVFPFVCVLICAYLFYTNLFTSLAEVPLITNNVKEHWNHNSPSASESFFRQAILIFPGTKHFLIPQGWTLSVEAIISLLIPFLILIARNGIGLLFIFIAILLLLLNVGKAFFELKFLFHFALGISIARYLPFIQNNISKWPFMPKALLLFFGLFFYQARFVDPSLLIIEVARPNMWYLTGFGSFLILIWILSTPIAQSVLRRTSLLYLGKISYSLYMVHYLVILVVTPKLITWLYPYINTSNILHGVVFILSMFFILVFSHLSYILFERGALKIGIVFRRVIALKTKHYKNLVLASLNN